MKKIKNDESGYIVIEAVVSFLLYLFLIISILSLINIIAVQARVHNAVTQAATSISMYSYVLEVTGASDYMKENAENASNTYVEANAFNEEINNLISSINSIDIKGVEGSANYIIDKASEAYDDPQAVMLAFLSVGVDKTIDQAFEFGLRPLIGRYLSTGNKSGDEHLKSMGVVNGLEGLNFYDLSISESDKSKFLNEKGELKIVVEYDIEYKFGALPLPFDEKYIHVKQTVITKSWLNGKGKGYQD